MNLLDVNMLIALCDSMHVHHHAASQWFKRESKMGWATCPMTENGFVRVMGQNAYPNGPQTPSGALKILKHLLSLPGHQFWNDNLSVTDDPIFGTLNNIGPKQITDIYLLGLAVSHQGRLVTLDQKIHTTLTSTFKDALWLVKH